jgi:NitT/TauT family transport system substrate-binding protein
MKQRPRVRRHLPALVTAAAAAVALTLAGCSGMSGESSSSDKALADCKKVDKVTVVLQWVAQAQFAGYYAAKDKDYYADACLDVTIQEGGANIVPQQVLQAGTAQFAVTDAVKSEAARQQGQDIVNISQVVPTSGLVQVSWADSGIKTLADLKGTRLGNWGSGNELALFAAMKASGVDPNKDVTLVQQGFDMTLLLSHEVDSAQATRYNEFAQLLETINPDTGKLYKESDFNVIDLSKVGNGNLGDGIYSSEGWLKKSGNEDIAKRFVEASLHGWISCRDDAQSCVDLVVKHGSSLGASHQEWMMSQFNQMIWPSKAGIGVLDTAAWDSVMKTSIEGGVIKKMPDKGAYRTDINAAALAALKKDKVDVDGADYTPETVTLTEGGK